MNTSITLIHYIKKLYNFNEKQHEMGIAFDSIPRKKFNEEEPIFNLDMLL